MSSMAQSLAQSPLAQHTPKEREYIGDGIPRNAGGKPIKEYEEYMKEDVGSDSLTVGDYNENYWENVDISARLSREPADQLLNDVRAWFERFIITRQPSDLDVLALWTVHTFMLRVLPVSPRLIIDSIMYGSGKTTVLEHINYLGHATTLASAFGSAAMIPRMIDAAGEDSISILIDEADRTLDPSKENAGDLIAVINSGYKRGATRPVSVPDKQDGWKVKEMQTYAAIAMAGNAPKLPADTKSRSISVFLLPDIEEAAEETDWVSDDTLSEQAQQLHDRIKVWAQLYADQVQAARPIMPERCRNRVKERWISFAKIADVAGDTWKERVNNLINADIERMDAEKADGLNTMPPKVVLIRDMLTVFGEHDELPTITIVNELIQLNPEQWGMQSTYGKNLTRQRLAKMLSDIGIHSHRPYRDGAYQARCYRKADIEHIAKTLHLTNN